MQVSPFLSPAPSAPVRAERQDAPRVSTFDSVFGAEDRGTAHRPDAATRDASEAAERNRGTGPRREDSVGAADPEGAAPADEANDTTPVEGSDAAADFADTASAETAPGEQADFEDSAESRDEAVIAVAEAPARPTAAKAEAPAAETSTPRPVAAPATGAQTAAHDAPADKSETQTLTQPAAASPAPGVVETAAPRAAAKPFEEKVVVRRVDAAESAGEDTAPRVEPTPRETEVKAPKPTVAVAESPAAPTLDAGQQLPDPERAEIGGAEPRNTTEHMARADSTVRHDPHRPVMSQVADAARALRDGPVELTLQPEELGRVRMTMSAGADGTMTMSLHAERPETLDLLRRNIGDLARELADLGFSNLSFSFGQDRAQADQHQPEGGREGTPSDRTVATVPLAGPSLAARSPLTPASGGLDIRL